MIFIRFSLGVLHVSEQSLPVTSLRFRPAATQGKTRNVLVACNAAGEIQHWHITSGERIPLVLFEQVIWVFAQVTNPTLYFPCNNMPNDFLL